MNTQKRTLIVLAGLLALLAAPAAAQITLKTCTVTSNADSGEGTLREAIANCNIILFDKDYDGANTIRLASPLIIEKGPMNIIGPAYITGKDQNGTNHNVVISGDTDGDGVGNVQLMQVYSTVNLRNLTLTKGYCGQNCFGPGGTELLHGGAIYVAPLATLYLEDCTFSDNVASYGGAIYLDRTTQRDSIYAYRVNFLRNSAQFGGAIGQEPNATVLNRDGQILLIQSRFVDNEAAAGGAIFLIRLNRNLVIDSSSFLRNKAKAGSAVYIVESPWVPAVTISVWPSGCVCHAVRAPGSNVTEAPATRAGAGAWKRWSMRTFPVNQSAGPFADACEPACLISIFPSLTANVSRRHLLWPPPQRRHLAIQRKTPGA